MNVPSYISQLLDEELQKVKLQVLQAVSAKYNIDLEDLKRTVLPDSSKVKPHTDVNIKIIKTRKMMVEEGERCKARIWNRGTGGQCNRRHVKGELCSQHSTQLETKGTLKHGWIHEKPPQGTFHTKRPTALYK